MHKLKSTAQSTQNVYLMHPVDGSNGQIMHSCVPAKFVPKQLKILCIGHISISQGSPNLMLLIDNSFLIVQLLLVCLALLQCVAHIDPFVHCVRFNCVDESRRRKIIIIILYAYGIHNVCGSNIRYMYKFIACNLPVDIVFRFID